MEREIKFRGKQLDNGEWTYGYLFGIWERRYILWGTTNDVPNMIEVDPSTVGQHTGLKDKNGKEIYEGDILNGGTEYTPYYGLPHVEICDCENSDYVYKNGDDDYSDDDHADQYGVAIIGKDFTTGLSARTALNFEVIGNLSDTPELLKEDGNGKD
jgi:uncharacterized phage protein (TIGR01671 family)